MARSPSIRRPRASAHDPTDILTHLAAWVAANTYPNLQHPHGRRRHRKLQHRAVDYLRDAPAVVPGQAAPCSPTGLRRLTPASATSVPLAAFLVSSRLQGGVVQYVRIASEQGGCCGARSIRGQAGPFGFYRNGADAGTLEGAEVTIPTANGGRPQPSTRRGFVRGHHVTPLAVTVSSTASAAHRTATVPTGLVMVRRRPLRLRGAARDTLERRRPRPGRLGFLFP